MDLLQTYASKRDFSQTSEPAPTKEPKTTGPVSFVIQKHAASRLHYDLRLENGGVLKSWAVPKGMPRKKGERRFAVQTEDHPLAYADFEGNIPKGEYGGGTVIVWDRGGFIAEEKDVAEALTEGKLTFRLLGQKVNASFTLIRTDKDDQWLLLGRDGNGSAFDEASVISGRTIEQVRQGVQRKAVVEAPSRKVPQFLAPMVPEEHPRPFDDDAWTFELKLDGIRAIALRDGDEVRILTRQGNDVTGRFPGIVTDLMDLPDSAFGLDGEIVMVDAQGRPSFHALMERVGLRSARTPDRTAQFWIFDMTHSEGRDLRRLPLRERRICLEALCPSTKTLRVLDTYPGSGTVLYEQATAMGFEGIVAKRLDSPYRDGQRSPDWRKVKRYHTEEFLVAGYTRGMGSREHTFGALILARQTESGLRFCGSVGGGFSDVRLEEIKALLDAQTEIASPFDGPIDIKGQPRFVVPQTVVEVRFMEWTPQGRLRMPQFVRLRPDLERGVPLDVHPHATDEVEEILAALDEERPEARVRIDGNEINLTSLDKPLWPVHGQDPAFTKRDLLAYYSRISRVLLPHLKDRPLAIVRHPDGIAAPGFFQKHLDEAPPFVQRVPIWSSHNKEVRNWIVCNDLATLIWLGQMSTVEIHPWYSRIVQEPDAHGYGTDFSTEDALDDSVLSFPDFVVFDLDPAFPGLPQEDWWEPTVRVGKALRELLLELGLRSYPKSSGKSGLHVYVPLRRDHGYDELRALAEGIGRHLVADRSLGVTMEWKVANRPAGIFFDHNQNVRGKTLAAPYSPRPVVGAPVSMPLKWNELEAIRPSDLHIKNVPSFIAERGDAWADLLADCQKLWFNPE